MFTSELPETLSQDDEDEIRRKLDAIALSSPSPAGAKPPRKAAGSPVASLCREKDGIAIMCCRAKRSDERVAVVFPRRACGLEVVASGRVVVSGTWRFEVSQHGRRLAPESSWESNCWYTDDEVDYLELEIALAAGVRVQRQIVLAREDRFLFLADAVLSPQGGGLEYRGALPLAPRVGFRGAAESREGFLVEGRQAAKTGKPAAQERPLAQVLPVGMPEWRAELHSGELTATAEGLELRQSTAAARLLAPLFIDLDRRRFRRRMTWRRLTVAESLAAVPPETAVGFRVAVGNEQWLIYRALAGKANRTLLGHNLSTESLFARFGKNGEVTSIVEIE